MERPSVDLMQARLVAEAIAIGLLVGIERYKDRRPGERRSAGVRTFTAFALLGGVCGLVDRIEVSLVSFVALAVLVAIGYFRESERSPGLTTETAAFIVFWLGFLVHSHEILAISTAIVLTIVLAAKETLHAFVRNSINDVELFDTLKFLAVVLVVYPLLPDRAMGPYGFFNPANFWLLVILVSTIGYVGYFLIRVLGETQGLLLSTLLGGTVSSLATTAFLANRARSSPASSRLLGVGAVAANAAQFPRLLLLVAVVSAPFARELAPVLCSMAAIGFLGAAVLSRRTRSEHSNVQLLLTNPYSLTPALKFGLFFVSILFLVRFGENALGDGGILVACVLGGFASASAVALSLASLVNEGDLSIAAGIAALVVGISANALVKAVVSATQGTARFALWVTAGLGTMLAAGYLLLAFEAAASAS